MKLVETALPEVKIVEPTVFSDDRGFFMEVWHAEKFAEAGLDVEFVQDNHSRSTAGTLRGLHYQVVRPQGKLVRCPVGEIFDVAVDIRRSSPTFGTWVGVRLSEENHRQLWIPPGFAHGFLALRDASHVLYKCTEIYLPEHDRSLRWDDPEIGIEWPLEGAPPRVSEKDATAPSLREAELCA
ncbi:MAG: dTDP-4-dehydrorhamnose 3,5-epimerase [Longimicrobiales bacterium]|nr:dTDP-4-dehydrorhamnose 3,5-epimerase [Longimicrobiales bacterium]